MTVGTIFRDFLAVFATAGGGAAIAWAIFSKFGDRWLENAFAKRFEAFKHEQAKELEHLRHKITSLFSRISKIHDKEFEVLPVAWFKLHEAYGRIYELCSAYKEFPELGQMNALHFEAFVAACGLH